MSTNHSGVFNLATDRNFLDTEEDFQDQISGLSQKHPPLYKPKKQEITLKITLPSEDELEQDLQSRPSNSFNFIKFMQKVASKTYSQFTASSESLHTETHSCSTKTRRLWQKATSQIILSNRALMALGKVKGDLMDFGTGKQQLHHSFQLEHIVLPFKCIILPTNKAKMVWDIITIVLLVYTATFVPFKLSFLDNSSMAILVIDYIVDALFALDILVNFLTAFFNQNGELVTDRCKIASNYLKSWFLFDFLVCFPFQLVLPGSSSNQYNGLVRLVKLPRLYRMFRILKLFKLLKSLKKSNPYAEKMFFKLLIHSGRTRLISTLFVLMLFIHLLSCTWYLTARLTGFEPNCW
jgi:hypothetical protein